MANDRKEPLNNQSQKNSGSYIIVFKLNVAQEMQIGKLGNYFFESGYYLYAGSGLKNLKQRVARHLSKDKALKWHIDYLSVKCGVVWYKLFTDGKNYECVISSKLNNDNRFVSPVKGFGSSDCKCYSHLFFTKEKHSWENLLKDLY
jgi:Uri superfamily endonuclease